jgi:Lipase (class 3)
MPELGEDKPQFKGVVLYDRELMKMMAEFSADVYGPLQYTEKSTQTAPILDLKGKSALKVLKNETKKVRQVETKYLKGYHVVDSIVCSSGVLGTEQYFGCLMYKKSSWDQAAEQFLAGPDQKKIRSIINITRERTIDEIKKGIRDAWKGPLADQIPNLLQALDQYPRERRILIAFRGTKKQKDWMSNGDAVQASFRWGKVHQGFLNIYNSGKAALFAKFDQLLPKDPALQYETQVLVTGHSLGGALATLCAADLSDRSNLPTPILYTFASPQVGNSAFAEGFNTRMSKTCNAKFRTSCSVRVYRPMDIVPKLPGLPGYTHVENAYELAGIDSSGASGGVLPGGKPHGMAKYRELIQAA